jgi:(p)ppGpp synthase/HD superfamily hydrolase
VHRSDCTNATSLRSHPERIVEVSWDLGPGTLFLVQIQVLALDREGLLSDITRVLADNGVNILGANVSTNKDRFAVFDLPVRDGRLLPTSTTSQGRQEGHWRLRDQARRECDW